MESNERSATLAIAPFLLVLSSIAVVVRVAAKNIQQRSWAVHDYFTFFAQFCVVVHVASIIVAAVEETVYVTTIQGLWISEWFWTFSVASSRTAAILWFVTFFGSLKTSRTANITAYVTYVAIAITLIIGICVISAFCKSIDAYFVPVIFNSGAQSLYYECLDLRVFRRVRAGISLLLDLWVTLFPLPAVWGGRFCEHTKIIVSSILSIGIAIFALNIGDMIRQTGVEKAPPKIARPELVLISTAHMTLSITFACIPALVPVLERRAQGMSLFSRGQNFGAANNGPSYELGGGEPRSVAEYSESEKWRPASINSQKREAEGSLVALERFELGGSDRVAAELYTPREGKRETRERGVSGRIELP